MKKSYIKIKTTQILRKIERGERAGNGDREELKAHMEHLFQNTFFIWSHFIYSMVYAIA